MNKKARFNTGILMGVMILAGGTLYAGLPATKAMDGKSADSNPVIFPLDIKFDTDKAVIKPGAQNDAEFKKLVQELNNYPYAKVEIQGYTDATGTDAVNQKLSEERAEAVRQRFVKEHGIAPTRIQAVGFGENKPATTNETASGRMENRRVIARIFRLEPHEAAPDGNTSNPTQVY